MSVPLHLPLHLLKITTDSALFSVNRTIDGVERIFFITFVKGDDGNWLVESF
jgi:hypothetical protein